MKRIAVSEADRRAKEAEGEAWRERRLFSPRYDLALIPCTSRKNITGMTARSLYMGGPFATMMRHAQQRADRILILSAKFGLLELDAPVSYYDAYLPDLSPQMRERLIVRLRGQLQAYSQAHKPWEQTRTLSYLPLAYYEAVAEASRSVAETFCRPYRKLPMIRCTAVLSAEIVTYGKSYQLR
jgi:hypothetical protein